MGNIYVVPSFVISVMAGNIRICMGILASKQRAVGTRYGTFNKNFSCSTIYLNLLPDSPHKSLLFQPLPLLRDTAQCVAECCSTSLGCLCRRSSSATELSGLKSVKSVLSKHLM